MRFTLYTADNHWFMSSNDPEYVADITARQVRHLLEQMSIHVKGQVVIKLYDRGVLVKERLYRADIGRLFPWREPK